MVPSKYIRLVGSLPLKEIQLRILRDALSAKALQYANRVPHNFTKTQVKVLEILELYENGQFIDSSDLILRDSFESMDESAVNTAIGRIKDREKLKNWIKKYLTGDNLKNKLYAYWLAAKDRNVERFIELWEKDKINEEFESAVGLFRLGNPEDFGDYKTNPQISESLSIRFAVFTIYLNMWLADNIENRDLVLRNFVANRGGKPWLNDLQAFENAISKPNANIEEIGQKVLKHIKTYNQLLSPEIVKMMKYGKPFKIVEYPNPPYRRRLLEGSDEFYIIPDDPDWLEYERKKLANFIGFLRAIESGDLKTLENKLREVYLDDDKFFANHNTWGKSLRNFFLPEKEKEEEEEETEEEEQFSPIPVPFTIPIIYSESFDNYRKTLQKMLDSEKIQVGAVDTNLKLISQQTLMFIKNNIDKFDEQQKKIILDTAEMLGLYRNGKWLSVFKIAIKDVSEIADKLAKQKLADRMIYYSLNGNFKPREYITNLLKAWLIFLELVQYALSYDRNVSYFDPEVFNDKIGKIRQALVFTPYDNNCLVYTEHGYEIASQIGTQIGTQMDSMDIFTSDEKTDIDYFFLNTHFIEPIIERYKKNKNIPVPIEHLERIGLFSKGLTLDPEDKERFFVGEIGIPANILVQVNLINKWRALEKIMDNENVEENLQELGKDWLFISAE